MNRHLSVVGIMLSVLLISCSSPTPATTPTTTPSAQNEAPVNLGQTLPITAQAMIAERTIDLEVAQTQEQQATGLMYRKSLADDRGMLFPFDPPQPVRFWMKNVYIPLDMIFIQDGKVTAIAASVPPCNTEICPTYGPATAVNQVIELRGGRAAQLGIKVGDQVIVKVLESNRFQP